MKSTTFLLLVALAASPALAESPFPTSVVYEGEVLDADGNPLSGAYPAEVTYFDMEGQQLFNERFRKVSLTDGRLVVELGTGRRHRSSALESLHEVFARHPEIQMEFKVGNRTQAPRIGVLPAGHSAKSILVAAGLRNENDDDPHWKHYNAQSGITAFQAGTLAPAGLFTVAQPVAGQVWVRPYEVPMAGPVLSDAVSDLPVVQGETPVFDAEAINPPRHETLFDQNGDRFGTTAPEVFDPVVGTAIEGGAPPLNVSFEGINNINGVLPPDTEGAVGPNHYVQMVNLSFAVYDKSGGLLAGPANTSTLWGGFGGPCQVQNSGDAIALYDRQQDRFVLSQFAVGGGANTVCFAVSQTPDPTGAYFLYSVVTPRFPDYYKLGTWPVAAHDAYFMGTNSGFQGAYDVFALDRANMLAGASARPMQLFQSFPNLIMPADSDGPMPPPAGSPGMLFSFRAGGESYFGSPPEDSLDLYEFAVDWVTPGNTTFTLAETITETDGLANFNWTVCGFFVQNCIPQPSTAVNLDSASWWPMQRLVHRTFSGHETLLGSWTVEVDPAGDRAAPRWFELRRSAGPWSIFQQGTHSPDAIHRWMPSIAMDDKGNIAIGYSRGDDTLEASIYYATRLTTDPLGTLQPEAEMFQATGSQTHGASRWGDYSSMDSDPADGCTFWYTTEYIQATGSAPWRTRIASFTIPACLGEIFSDGFESGDTSAWQ